MVPNTTMAAVWDVLVLQFFTTTHFKKIKKLKILKKVFFTINLKLKFQQVTSPFDTNISKYISSYSRMVQFVSFSIPTS